MGGDADYMLENGLDPFMKKNDDGEIVEWESGLNPLYRDTRNEQDSIMEMHFATFNEASAFAKSNLSCTVIRSPNGNGFICEKGQSKQSLGKMTIRELLLLDSDLLIKMLSLYYPFREVDVRDYWCVLEKGTAHYSVYMNDTSSVYSPNFGLCFNENIVWTPSLKKLWEKGIWDPFVGECYGQSDLPLSVFDEIRALSFAGVQQYADCGGGFEEEDDIPYIDEEPFRRRYPALSYDQFLAIHENSKNVLLLNPSVWENTISPLFSAIDVFTVLEVKKELSPDKDQAPVEFEEVSDADSESIDLPALTDPDLTDPDF